MKKLEALTRIWEGQDCYILGPGLSLPRQFGVPDEIIEKVVEGTFPLSAYRTCLEPLKDKNIIGLDAAYVYGDWVDVIFFWSNDFYSAHRRRGLDIHPAIKVSTHPRFQDPSHGVHYLVRDEVECGLSDNPVTLRGNFNSGGATINLAVQLGAKRIILLGFDYPAISLSHFIFKSQQKPGKPANFESFEYAMTQVAEDAEKLGIEIVNANPDSLLKVFRKESVDKLFKKPSLHQDKIALVTPTCSPERKPFLDFVKKRMADQTRKADMHIIIDRTNGTGKSDLAQRYREGLDQAFKAGATFALLIEDDDYYPVDYVETMYEAWKKMGKPYLIGQQTSYYYHLFTRGYDVLNPKKHTSAHCTGVAADANYNLATNDENPFFDIQLWKHNQGVLIDLEHPVVSIKHGLGMCGGRGHNKYDFKKFDDAEYTKLRSLVDEEAFDLYLNIIKENDPVTPEYYDRVYSDSKEYAKTEPSDSMYYPVYKRVNEMIEVGLNVMELGCGTGLLAKLLLSEGKNYKRGWDFSEVAIEKAKEINPDYAAKFRVGDLTRLPMRRTDVVVSIEVLEYLVDDLALINRLPECMFIFSVPDFMIPAHQRAFETEEQVRERYNMLDIEKIEKIQVTPDNGVWLVKSYRR